MCRKRSGLIPVLTAFLIASVGTTVSGGENPDAKVAVHVIAHDDLRTCSRNFPEIAGCGDISTTFEGCTGADVFPVFFGLTEYLGVEYGLAWPGSGSCTFTSCSDLHIGSISFSGDGISQVWTTCRPGPAVIPGFGWIDQFDPGQVCVVSHPHSDAISVLDCHEAIDEPTAVFCAGVCGEVGDDPCEAAFLPLGLSKADDIGAGCVYVGEYIDYVIDYDNAANWDEVHNVILTDQLSPEVEYVSSSAGGSYNPGEHSVTWNLGTLAGGGSGTVGVTVEVGAGVTPGAVLANLCTITSDEAPPTEVTEHTDVCSGFQSIELAKSYLIDSTCVDPGEPVTYRIRYENPNAVELQGVAATDYLSAATDFVSCSAGGVYESGTHTVSWQIGSLPAGTGDSLEVVVVVKPETTPGLQIVNTCEITSNETATVSDQVATVVCGGPTDEPLNLSKSDNLGGQCADRGVQFIYTISYDNQGNPDEVHNVVLVDELPNIVHFVSATGGGVYNGSDHEVIWDIGTLAGGGSGAVELTVRLDNVVPPGIWFYNRCEIAGDETGVTEASRATKVCEPPQGDFPFITAVHVEEHLERRSCAEDMPVITACEDIITTTEAWNVDVFPVFYEIEEYLGVEYGLWWDPGTSYPAAFTSCSDLTIGDIANPGDGVSQTWTSCQTGPAAIPGWAWIYGEAPTFICVVHHPMSGAILVLNCEEQLGYQLGNSCAGIYGAPGDDPCGGPQNVQPTTWGNIKSMFK